MEDTEIKSWKGFQPTAAVVWFNLPDISVAIGVTAWLLLFLIVQYFRVKAPQISINTRNKHWASCSQALVCVIDFIPNNLWTDLNDR